MYKILISGYYGFNNIGDESILQAVVNNLTGKLEGIEITVLSQNPKSTTEKYGINSEDRKSAFKVAAAVKECNLLISGGGSLLQDTTSKKSIYYYLMIMWLAAIFRKKYFIYSQGIGPINSKLSRIATAATLNRASGIVVRDEASKDLLVEIGVPGDKVVITADPVLALMPADLEVGQSILKEEGLVRMKGKKLVGFAIKERKLNSRFVDELEKAIRRLVDEEDAQVVLIPFHFQEDMAVIEVLEERLGEKVFTIKHKYLTNEMLSIIGNMDVLVGVRLHSLIHAAIMKVRMIGISYDPKINSFLNSIGLKALSTTIDFNSEYFMEEYHRVIDPDYDSTCQRVQEKVDEMVKSLGTNEEMIRKIMEGHVVSERKNENMGHPH